MNKDNSLILYATEDGEAQFVLKEMHGSVWLSQLELAELFQTTKQNISKHIQNILDDGELPEHAVVNQKLTTAADGKEYPTKLYNLHMILAVGYRVRSVRGTQFRQWATRHLSEYITKGFVMDDERLKNPGWDYFDELLERIRDIRASEKRFYQKVRELFSLTSSDYNKNSEEARLFFQTIQNKMLFAVTGQTAAELVVARADSSQPNMGLTSWHGNKVRKRDVAISKNYLNEEEVQELNRLTTMFLDFAEDRAKRRQQLQMQEWLDQTDRFLDFNERNVLQHAGSISHQRMETVVGQQYDAFDASRKEAERLQAEEDEVEETLHAIEEAAKLVEREKP